jgi:hypothetical protein
MNLALLLAERSFTDPTGNGVAAPFVGDGRDSNASLLRSLMVLGREQAEREARENALFNHQIAALLGISRGQAERQAKERFLASLLLNQGSRAQSLGVQNLERTALALDNLKDNATALAVAGLVGLSNPNPTSSSSSSLAMEQSSRSTSSTPLKAGKTLESKQKGRVGTFPQVNIFSIWKSCMSSEYCIKTQSTFFSLSSRNFTRCYRILKNPRRLILLPLFLAAEGLLFTSQLNLQRELCPDTFRRRGVSFCFGVY